MVVLGVYRSVWTSVITLVDWFLAKKMFQSIKVEKCVLKNFPLSIFKILCIFQHFLPKKRARKLASAIKKFYVFGISEEK